MIGLGYRKDFADQFCEAEYLQPDFIEVAPENWIDVGGYWKKQFMQALEKAPLYTHGLSLSIGSPDPIDFDFLSKIKTFLDDTEAKIYSEHLSFSKCDNAHVYDLLPIPFTKDAVLHIADRVDQVQNFLGRKLALEIVSYYTPVAAEMTELEFVKSILKTSGCDLLLDVNNIYVNAFNHKYNAKEFLDELPLEQVTYMHMAGHTQVADDLIIDTHGEDIIDPVFDLYQYTCEKLGRIVPTLLERDFNMPELTALQKEIDQLRIIQSAAVKQPNYASA